MVSRVTQQRYERDHVYIAGGMCYMSVICQLRLVWRVCVLLRKKNVASMPNDGHMNSRGYHIFIEAVYDSTEVAMRCARANGLLQHAYAFIVTVTTKKCRVRGV